LASGNVHFWLILLRPACRINRTSVGIPTRTPQEVIDKVASAIQAAVKEKSILDRLDTYGVDAIAAGPAEFKAIMLEDIAKWKAAIAAANISSRACPGAAVLVHLRDVLDQGNPSGRANTVSRRDDCLWRYPD